MVYVDLLDKAEWHKEFNGGMVPILENTDGTLVPESGIVQNFGLQVGGDKGCELIPSDPWKAADMRVKMEKFGSTLSPLWPLLKSRFLCANIWQEFLAAGAMDKWNEMCSNGKFLLGGDDITMLDIHCAPFWEILFYSILSDVAKGTVDVEHVKTKYAHWWAYMERFREHPVLKPYVMDLKCGNAFCTRAAVFDPNAKCQLSLPELGAAYPELL
jgi:glutathione S-transferase